MKPGLLPPLLLLPGRMILFLAFQLSFALFSDSFEQSAGYWILAATATNILNIVVLIRIFKSEGRRYHELFGFDKTSLKKDIMLFSGVILVCLPVVFLPNYVLGIWLWGDPSVPFKMLFKPVPLPLAYILLVLFPVTIALAELATYFRYIMPALMKHLRKKWLAVFLPVLFLAIQHCTLPFIADFRFIVYRLLMYFPFACLIGIMLYKRPRLFPYFAVMHGLLDFGAVILLLEVSKS